MAEVLTEQQRAVVTDRGGKLLVSAAAGSGKTKVLVDRLLLYITESGGKINIDDFLIITYTKAAAAELRGKIAAKLNERLAEDPGNKHLQRQLQRLYLTKISTVHAFCSDILREYAYRLDIAGDFRVAEEAECTLLQLQVMDKLLDKAYDEADPDFLAFIDSQELGRDDRSIPQIILKVYESAKCHVDPDKWLEACMASNDSDGVSDASQTVWGQFLVAKLHSYLDMQIAALTKCADKAEQNGTMEKPAILLRDTISQLTNLRNMTLWDDIVQHKDIDYGRLNFGTKHTDAQLAERIKAVRNACKSGLEKKLLPFADLSEQVLDDLNSCANASLGLVGIVKKFAKEYDAVKRSMRILDFSDLEHKMLDLLVGKQRTGMTSVASEIGDRFVEIMVDEYQDSNAVQDMIFSALTEKRQNCFMVGDVKQSIYQFRLADPQIFLEKYHRYVPAEFAAAGQGRKIMLSSNFRSAGPVIHAVNDVFTNCMNEDVGGLVYGEDEALREGIPHEKIHEAEVELCVLDVQEETYPEEAAYTAQRICGLLDGTHMVRDKNGLRPITPEDIVILLRSPGSVGNEFRYALEARGIRVNYGKGGNLLESEEVAYLRGMMQIIDNPLQDIPMLAVLTSRYISFTADDLAVIRAGNRRVTVYESLKKSQLPKVADFLTLLSGLRAEAKLLTLSDLIGKIITISRMDSVIASMEDSAVKQGNVQAFCELAASCEGRGQKGLAQFLDFLDSSEEKGLQMSSDQNIPGAVTIMSIHKSKGLEFPVVFLCGLSRDFNTEDARAQILCHKELGIGMNCVDLGKRIRYPSIAKKAIAAKILEDALSEEMRILYVAMTRAKDRLIMTYAVPNAQKDIAELVNCMDICDKKLLISGVSCPGSWILLTALRRMESGALFELAGCPDHVEIQDDPWSVVVETVAHTEESVTMEDMPAEENVILDVDRLQSSLAYRYPNAMATTYPSKMTATQLKGRAKDQEASENTEQEIKHFYRWRAPSFADGKHMDGVDFGNAVHKIMQYLDLKNCNDVSDVAWQIKEMVESGLLNGDCAKSIEPQMIWSFLDSDIGTALRRANEVIREFKFSVLQDGSVLDPELKGENILLQGVVDCAVIEPDGITVVDYKTDAIHEDNVDALIRQYSMQVKTYAQVLSEIYERKVKASYLYFFRSNLLVPVI